MTELMATVSTLALLVYVAQRLPIRGMLLCQDMVVLGLALYFFGSCWVWLESPSQHTEDILKLSSVALASASLASCFHFGLARRNSRRFIVRIPNGKSLLLSAVMVITANLLFSYLVYHFLLGGSISAIWNGELLNARKLISSGEDGYFFPGAVKQFRDVMAPVLILMLLAYAPRSHWLLLASLISTTVVAIVLGGQRMPLLVLAFAIAAAATIRSRSTPRPSRSSWRPTLLIVSLAILCMIALNEALGRSGEADGRGNHLLLAIRGIMERIIYVPPAENAAALSYLRGQSWAAGQIWLSDLAKLAPGVQAGVSNDLHEILGGSSMGNSAIGLPLGAYLNGGWPTVILAPALAVFGSRLIDLMAMNSRNFYVMSARLVVLIYLPIAYDPHLFLLNGGIFFLACWIISRTNLIGGPCRLI